MIPNEKVLRHLIPTRNDPPIYPAFTKSKKKKKKENQTLSPPPSPPIKTQSININLQKQIQQSHKYSSIGSIHSSLSQKFNMRLNWSDQAVKTRPLHSRADGTFGEEEHSAWLHSSCPPSWGDGRKQKKKKKKVRVWDRREGPLLPHTPLPSPSLSLVFFYLYHFSHPSHLNLNLNFKKNLGQPFLSLLHFTKIII